MTSTEADFQIEFAQKLLCDNRINHDQYHFIISNIPNNGANDVNGVNDDINSDNYDNLMVDAISDLGLANEFRNFKAQIDRNNQDASYQISMINDQIKEIKENLARIQLEHEKTASEYEIKEKTYETVKGRFSKFPDNPRLIQEMADAEKDFTPIRDLYLHNQRIIKEYQDSIVIWEKQIHEL